MERFVIMREERYRAVKEEQYEYHNMAPPKEDLKLMSEHFGKRAEQKAFAHDYQRQNNYCQRQGGGCKGPYLHATVVHQLQCYQPPPMSQTVQISLAHHDQTVSHHEERYPLVYQQHCYQPPPMAHKVQTSLAHHDQTVSHHKGRYPQTGIPREGHVQQQVNIGNQVLPPKKHGGVMDCNEVAKHYGGLVFTDYGRNKYPVRA